jgi:sugar-specific transcriptional regulator TrmB
MTIKRFVCTIGFGALLLGPSAYAQVQRSGGGESQRIMQQYQQIAAEKTALQGQLAQAKKDLDAANANLAAMKKERDALKARAGGASESAAVVARLTASKESAEKDSALQKQRMTELVTRFRETATNLRDVEADRTKLHKDLDERNAAYDKCAENNLQLYELTGDVLKRYEHVGLFTKVSATEPFTKITRTRIENLVDEYRARAQELRAKKRTP